MSRTKHKQSSSIQTDLVWALDDEFPSHEIEQKMLQEQGYNLVVTRSASYREDYGKYAPYAKGILLQVSFLLGAEDIAGLVSCKIIAVTGGGFELLDVAAATRHGIIATYVPNYCVEEVSDHVLGLIIALNHRFPDCQNMVSEGLWKAIDIGPFKRLRGQVLGLVGFGRISRAVAQKAKCIGLQLKAYDPYVSEFEMRELGVESVGFSDVVSSADLLSLHVPLTKETYHMINKKAFDAMKDTAYLINTCRGEVVDELALIEALEAKKIAGAGLDVLAQEPSEPNNPLLSMRNVIVTPHSGYLSQEALRELQVRSIKQVTDALQGRIPEDTINPEVIDRARAFGKVTKAKE